VRIELFAGISSPVEHEPFPYPGDKVLPRFLFHLPGGVGIDLRFRGRIALHQEAGALADDRERSVNAEVQYRGGYHVVADA